MICPQCGFERGNRQKCKECNRRYQSKWYQANKDKQISRSRNREDRIYEKLYDYLVNHPCVDCGLVDPVVMHFDHKDRNDKLATVGQLIRNGVSWTKVEAEILKCDVRCANCHMRRTAEQFGWRKRIMGEGR